MNYRVTLVESDEGWAGWCDDLRGCCTQGETREEALANMRTAIAEYLEARDEVLRGGGGVRSIAHEEIALVAC